MRNLIRKILKESDDFDWIRDTELDIYNPVVGMRWFHVDDENTVYTVTSLDDKHMGVEWVDTNGVKSSMTYYGLSKYKNLLRDGKVELA